MPNPPLSRIAQLRRSSAVFLSVLLFSLLQACGMMEGGLLGPGECAEDADCNDGLLCQASLCVDGGGRPMSVALQLTFSGSKLPRQVSKLTFVPTTALPDIAAQPLVPVHVEVTRSSEPIPASVRFKAQRAIPGTTAEVWGEAGSQGSRLELLPGSYEVSVRPAAETGLPSKTFRGVEVHASSDGGPLTLTLALVEPELGQRLVMLVGRLELQYEGSEERLPARDVVLWAVSSDGLFESQKYSICDASEFCDGAFELILPAQSLQESRSYQLMIEGTSSAQPVPRMKLSAVEIDGKRLESATALTADTLVLDIGQQRADGVPRFRSVSGVVYGPDEQGVQGAVISARGQLGAEAEIAFSVTAAIPSDEQGRFEILMPDSAEVQYTLQANVEMSSPLGSVSVSGVGVPAALELALRAKPVLRGQISGRRSDELVEHASLTAVPVALSEDGSVKGSQATTKTDAEGRYALPLEAGQYLLSIEPPVAGNLAQRRLQIAVEASESELMLNVKLGRSSLLFGRVLDAEDKPAANVLVEVFATNSEGSDALVLGSGSTGADGVYRVIVPHTDDFDFATWLQP